MIHDAYLAGILDGEGCIGTTRTGKQRTVTMRVTVANTDHEFLRALKAQYDGVLNLRSTGAKSRWKPFGSISWTHQAAHRILERALPYLIIKRAQALVALDLIRLRDAPFDERFDVVHKPVAGYPNRRERVVKAHVRLMEEALAARLTHLNRKGPRGDRTVASLKHNGETIVSLDEARKAGGK